MKTAIQTEERLNARRAAMPVVSALVNELRETFPDAAVIYAQENGITVGKRPCRENAFTIPPNYRKPAGGWPR